MKRPTMAPWAFRRAINLFPAFRGTGGRVTRISKDWMAWDVKIPLNWRTRNYVGTTYGGSLYGAVDPILMLAYLRILGPGYIVWDKAATIRFRRPGRTTLYAKVRIDAHEVDEVRRLCEQHTKVDRTYPITITDAHGIVHAEVEKILHFRRRKEKEREEDAPAGRRRDRGAVTSSTGSASRR